MRLIRYSRLVAAPWKSGVGETREIAVHPSRAGGVGKTWGSCSGPAVGADQPSIKNGSPHDGDSVCAFG